MKIGGSRRLLGVGSVVLAAAAGVVGVVIFANPAGAWHSTLSGKAECDESTGTYTVAYSGTATNAGTVTVKSSTPTDNDVTVSAPSPSHVGDNGTFTVTQTGVSGQATEATLTTHVTWDQHSNESGDAYAQVKLGGDCALPPTQATATAPTFTNGTCASPSSTYTIPEATGVDYEVAEDAATQDAATPDAAPSDAATPGTHTTSDNSITITASAEAGYQLTGDHLWTHTYPAAPAVCTGTAPSFTNATCAAPTGSYIIPVTDGIQYWINGDQASPGTHSAKSGNSVTITAVASDGHALTGTTRWTHTFPAVPTDCTETGQATAPTFVDTTCAAGGSYTIPSSTVAAYTANGASVSSGKHTAAAGTTVTIKASRTGEYALVGSTTWTHSYAQAPQCDSPPATDSPPTIQGGSGGTLAQTGPEVPVGKATLIAGLLALLGTLCLLAGRRPATSARHRVSKP